MITGGTFKKGTEADKDVGTYFPDGTSLEVNSDGKVIVKADAVAEVNNVGYASLQAAIDAAPSGANVTLLKGTTENVTISDGANFTLDLNGNTLDGGTQSGKAALTNNGGTITITDSKTGGTIKRSDNGPTGCYYTILNNSGMMTIAGGKVENNAGSPVTWSGSSLICNGPNKEATLIITGGTISQDNFIAVKNDEHGKLEIRGGTVSSNTQAVQNWCETTISGGTLTGNIATWAYSDVAGNTVINGNVVINGDVGVYWYGEESDYPTADSTVPTVNIAGGTVNGSLIKASTAGISGPVTPQLPTNEDGSIQVSGGVFKEDPTPYLTSGKELIRNADGTYSVRNETPSSGASSGGSSDPTYSPVMDVSDGGTVRVNPRTPEEGDEVTITVDPDSGYEVDEVTVTDRNGREVKVTAERDGTYTFTQPRGRVTISVTFVREGGSTFFSDVPESFWAYDEIAWAYDNGYVNGTSASSFSPNASISRQQVWMILARLSGADPANMSAAREWAVTNGVSDGTTPGGAVTRQQLVALLYRYATLMGYANDQRADLSAYPDAGTVAGYAVEPMQWSVANSIVGGTSNGTLDPTGTATRAQFAVILYRFWDQVG